MSGEDHKDQPSQHGQTGEHIEHQRRRRRPMQHPIAYYYPHHMPYMPEPIGGYNMDVQTAQQAYYAAYYAGYYGYQQPFQHMEGVPLPPGIPGLGGSTDPLEAVLGTFPCSRLRNLPYDVSIEDILLLFQGLVVIDVLLVGQGDAFVVFANPMDFQMALQRDRQTIQRRFIEISPASRAEYYDAIAKQQRHEKEGARMSRSASGSAGEDVGDEMHELQTTGDTAMAGLWRGTSSPPPMQPILSSFSSQSAFSEGMQMQQLVMSGRGAPSGPGGPGRGGLHAPMQKRTGGGIQVGEHTGFLRMRGLPFSASRDDIVRFFTGYNPVPESVVLTFRNDGRATGEAYIGFLSPEDSKRAMELHRKMMGSRYIELFISNKEEQSRALARFGGR